MNLFEYVEFNKDNTFNDLPFNDVDNIILSQIAYIPLDGVVEKLYGKKISIENASKLLWKKYIKKEISLDAKLYKNVAKLLKEMGTTKRYKELLLYNYEKIVDDDKQFGAVTIKLPNNVIYISFEGTDTAISGWKEDAFMTYKFPVPAQTLAAKYLKETVSLFDRKIMIGGHSKGGNLAISAAMKAPFYVRNRIIKIYNNDGPGFLEKEINSDEYKSILSKVRRIIPSESVFGVLLNQSSDLMVIKSSKKKLYQHDPFTWICDGTGFIKDNLSDYSKNVSIKMNRWLETFNENDRANCILDFFGLIEEERIYDTKEFINVKKIFNIIFRITKMEDKSKVGIKEAIKIVI